jgi:hypothetical protein
MDEELTPKKLTPRQRDQHLPIPRTGDHARSESDRFLFETLKCSDNVREVVRERVDKIYKLTSEFRREYGFELLEIKAVLNREDFNRLAMACFGLAERTAYNYMLLAEMTEDQYAVMDRAKFKNVQVEDEIAGLKPDLRKIILDKITEALDAGKKVSIAQVRSWKGNPKGLTKKQREALEAKARAEAEAAEAKRLADENTERTERLRSQISEALAKAETAETPEERRAAGTASGAPGRAGGVVEPASEDAATAACASPQWSRYGYGAGERILHRRAGAGTTGR